LIEFFIKKEFYYYYELLNSFNGAEKLSIHQICLYNDNNSLFIVFTMTTTLFFGA